VRVDLTSNFSEGAPIKMAMNKFQMSRQNGTNKCVIFTPEKIY